MSGAHVNLFAAYGPLLESLGWLAALMFAAVWPSLPGAIGRRHAGWLIGFCAVRFLLVGQTLVFGFDPEWQHVGAVLSGLALWEFARRVWNETGRHISAATHLGAAECLALVAAVAIQTGTARPSWFFPIDLCYALLPGLLGAGAMWLLSRTLLREATGRHRYAGACAVVGLGLFGLPTAGWSVLPPWLAAGGLGVVWLALPAARSRAAFICLAGLASIAACGPLVVSAIAGEPEGRERADVLARVEHAAAPLQRGVAARLAAERLDPATCRLLREYFAKLRVTDPLVHTASLWREEKDRVSVADLVTGEFGGGPASATPPANTARVGAYVLSADPARGQPFVTTCAPLSPGRFETPTAWLALEFPDVFWTTQHRQTQRTAVALVCVVAAFCAMGFVLIVRQQLENAQQLQFERMQAADRGKSEFLAFLGHELRTPLQTILGRADLLRRQPEAERHAVAIDAQGKLLLRLVNDLLDLGTIEAGHFRLRPAPFSLRPTLAAVEDTARQQADAKRLSLSVSIDPLVPDGLVGDEARLRQILGNLLSNAVKYTRQGNVTLAVTRDHAEPTAPAATAPLTERLVFTVSDTGPGLPPDKIGQLFTLFTRLDSGDTFTREGTGVGLALVRRLCTLMGGTVTAVNRPEGGAELTVRLAFPVADATTTAAAAPVDAVAFRARSVLVAEDNTAIRELLTEELSSLGHSVVAVADGPAAVAAAATRRFDVAVLDVNLPGIDGITVGRQLRAGLAPIRIVGCSAEALPAVRDAAVAAGFDAFLVKPVSLAALAQAVGDSEEPTNATLFDRLHSAETTTRARVVLLREWPRLRGETEAALRAGDESALRRLAHYLKSSALLLADANLLQLCEQLSTEPRARETDVATARLDAVGRHFAQWEREGS